MRNLTCTSSLVVLLLAVAAPSGCKKEATGEAPPTVTTVVAASAQDAVRELATRFRADTGIEVRTSAAGSNTLAAQIMNGAPADVFLSANLEWADKLKQQGLVAETRPLLTNDLVLVVPKGNPAGVKMPGDLAADRVKKIALAGEKVPCGTYARQALTARGVYDGLVSANKIARGQDVRGTLTYVERGEADAGIVYSTDARVSRDVEVAYTFDPADYEKIAYPLVLLKSAGTNEPARRFYAYLGSPAAEQVFQQYGFRVLR